MEPFEANDVGVAIIYPDGGFREFPEAAGMTFKPEHNVIELFNAGKSGEPFAIVFPSPGMIIGKLQVSKKV